MEFSTSWTEQHPKHAPGDVTHLRSPLNTTNPLFSLNSSTNPGANSPIRWYSCPFVQ